MINWLKLFLHPLNKPVTIFTLPYGVKDVVNFLTNVNHEKQLVVSSLLNTLLEVKKNKIVTN